MRANLLLSKRYNPYQVRKNEEEKCRKIGAQTDVCNPIALQIGPLDLIALLDKEFEPTVLRIEVIPTNVTVGRGERFCLIHQVSQLQIPGQFTNCEAEQILKLTRTWDWTVNLKTRVPACHDRLLNLLEDVCTPPQVQIADDMISNRTLGKTQQQHKGGDA